MQAAARVLWAGRALSPSLLAPWLCLWETVSVGSRVVSLLALKKLKAHNHQCETVLP